MRPYTNEKIHQLIDKGEPVPTRCAAKVIDRILFRKHIRQLLTPDPLDLLDRLRKTGGGPPYLMSKAGRAHYYIAPLIEWVETRLIPNLKVSKERAV